LQRGGGKGRGANVLPSKTNSTPSVCCKTTLDEAKSKYVGSAEQNGFGRAFLHRMLRLVKGTTKPNTCC